MSLGRIAIVVVGAALGFVACRPGDGDYCQCPGECRRGLVCAQGGTVIESCIPAGPDQAAGRCIQQEDVNDTDASGGPVDVIDYHDVGGKRDFQPTPSDESSTSPGTSSSDPSTTSSTSSSTSTSTGTSTGTSGSTGTSTGA